MVPETLWIRRGCTSPLPTFGGPSDPQSIAFLGLDLLSVLSNPIWKGSLMDKDLLIQ